MKPVTRKSYTCCRADYDDYNRERQPALVPFVLRALAKKQEITKSTAANGASGEREWGWVIGGTGEVAAGEGASAGGPCESRCATGGRRDSFGTGEVKGLTKPWADPRPSISRSSETIFKTHSPCHIKQMETYSLNVIRQIRFEGFKKLDLFICVHTTAISCLPMFSNSA